MLVFVYGGGFLFCKVNGSSIFKKNEIKQIEYFKIAQCKELNDVVFKIQEHMNEHINYRHSLRVKVVAVQKVGED